LEKLSAFSYGLYYTYINAIETHVIVSQKLTNKNEFLVWHDRLGHPGHIMMQKIAENSCGHPLKSQKLLQSNDFSCTTCSQGKLIIRPSPEKIRNESISFLERIQGDICGPIQARGSHLSKTFFRSKDWNSRLSGMSNRIANPLEFSLRRDSLV